MLHRTPDGRLVSFQDFPEEAFPIIITAFVGDEQIWERVIEPYVAVDIPGATDETAGKIRTRIRYGDGREEWEEPVSEADAEAYIAEHVVE